MSWWSDYEDQIECHAPLGSRTWFRLGGPARFLFRPRDRGQLAGLTTRARQEGLPVKVLGRGANVLVSDDGFDGVVIRLDHWHFRQVRRHGCQVEVGAGVDLMPLARTCSRKGWSGLEPMAGIPASVGGAIRMNAGGRHGEIADVVKAVTVMEPDGEVRVLDKNAVGFGYRRSALGERIVLSAVLELQEDDPARTLRRYDEFFELKRKTQPLSAQSAGCIFKNPAGKSAGALIDEAGFKGVRCGLAEVSRQHANFIVAREGARSLDVLRLIDLVRDGVRKAFNTELEVEVDIWGTGSEKL